MVMSSQSNEGVLDFFIERHLPAGGMFSLMGLFDHLAAKGLSTDMCWSDIRQAMAQGWIEPGLVPGRMEVTEVGFSAARNAAAPHRRLSS